MRVSGCGWFRGAARRGAPSRWLGPLSLPPASGGRKGRTPNSGGTSRPGALQIPSTHPSAGTQSPRKSGTFSKPIDTRVGGVWFRGPLGPRCRSETGAPVSGDWRGGGCTWFAPLWGAVLSMGFENVPLLGFENVPLFRGWLYVVRTPAGCGAGPHRENWPEVGVPWRFPRFSGGGCTWFAPLRGAMPVGDRRSGRVRRQIRLGHPRGLAVCGFAALSGRDAGRRPALQSM